VIIQVTVLIIISRLIFGIQWGPIPQVTVIALGVVVSAASFGIFINSLLKSSKQGGLVFGGILTVTSMLGLIEIFAMNSPAAARLGNTVSLLVPQGWAVHGVLQAVNGQPLRDVLSTSLVLLVWSIVFFMIGVWRFNRRYA
jgi:ABC-type multidrug transport system permease subunit